MCGRCRCSIRPDDIPRYCNLGSRTVRFVDTDRYRPAYNVSPGSNLPVIRRDTGANGEGVIVQCMKWGLIPSFSKMTEKPDYYKMFNARSESIGQNISLRSLLPGNRCLVVVEGFYEWKKDGSKKQPYYIHMKDDRPLIFAALYDSWKNTEGRLQYTFTILTTSSSSAFGLLHDRMPVILGDKGSTDEWLYGSSSSKFDSLLKPYEEADLVWYPVTPAISNPSFNGAECIKEIQVKETRQISMFLTKKAAKMQNQIEPQVTTESKELAKTEKPKIPKEEPETLHEYDVFSSDINSSVEKADKNGTSSPTEYYPQFDPMFSQISGWNQPPPFPTNLPLYHSTQISQNQFHASQPQSAHNDATPVPVPEPEPAVNNSKRKSSEAPARTGPALPQIWTPAEEAALVSAWIAITEENTATGNNAQIAGPFWKRVTQHFHSAMGRDDYRTNHQLNSKWRELNRKVAKFNDIYNNLLNQCGSGCSELGIFTAAHGQYRLQHNGSVFNYGPAWDVLKTSPEWVRASQMDHQTSGLKRIKTSDSNDYMTSSNAHCKFDFNDEGDEIEPEEPRRVIGRDKGKRGSASTLSGSGTDEKVDRLVDLFDNFTSMYSQYLELEKEKIRIKEIAFEEKRRYEDFKILTTKTDHLTGPALRVAVALKEEIVKKYGSK